MPSLLDVLAQLRNQAQPRQDLGGGRPYTFAGRVLDANQQAPGSIYDLMAKPAVDSPDAEGLGGLANLAAGAAAGKVFKPTPSTIEDWVRSLAKAQEGIGGRGRLLPTLRDLATNEEYIGVRGGYHPWEQYEAAMAARGGRTNMKQVVPGFKVAEDAPFIEPELVQYLAIPDGVRRIGQMLGKGSSIEPIIDALKFGKQVGRE